MFRQPEWYFAHIINVTHEHRSFLDNIIQHLLQQSSHYSKINAWVCVSASLAHNLFLNPFQREFCRLLLPIISRKLRRSVPALLPHPPLLAYTVYQALSFDDALREAGFSLIGTLEKSKEDMGSWEGTSDIVLGSDEWFDAWLEGERKCE